MQFHIFDKVHIKHFASQVTEIFTNVSVASELALCNQTFHKSVMYVYSPPVYII